MWKTTFRQMRASLVQVVAFEIETVFIDQVHIK